MNNWFRVAVQYRKQTEDGSFKETIEDIAVDAISFTEAEARVNKEMEAYKYLKIVRITKAPFAVVYAEKQNLSGRWIEVKIQYTSFNTKSGKEQKSTIVELVRENDLRTAYDYMSELVKDTFIESEIVELKFSKIVDIIEYNSTGAGL